MTQPYTMLTFASVLWAKKLNFTFFTLVIAEICLYILRCWCDMNYFFQHDDDGGGLFTILFAETPALLGNNMLYLLGIIGCRRKNSTLLMLYMTVPSMSAKGLCASFGSFHCALCCLLF